MVVPPALGRPPRTIPPSVSLVVLFGGIGMVVAWVVLGVGLLFAAIFVPLAAPLFDDPFAGQVTTVRGRVVEVKATHVRVNHSTVQAVHFEYAVDEPTRRGVSYALGAPPPVGTEVVIERAPAAGLARIRGMSTHMLPAVVRVLVLLPLLGVALLLVSLFRGWRRLQLLRHGELARGRLIASQATNTRIHRRRVHRLTFAFADAQGVERQTVVRTHRVDELTDEAEEPLLHDPTSGRAALLDDLPARPQAGDDGQLRPAPFGRVAAVLVAPTIVALGVQVAKWLVDLAA